MATPVSAGYLARFFLARTPEAFLAAQSNEAFDDEGQYPYLSTALGGLLVNLASEGVDVSSLVGDAFALAQLVAGRGLKEGEPKNQALKAVALSIAGKLGEVGPLTWARAAQATREHSSLFDNSTAVVARLEGVLQRRQVMWTEDVEIDRKAGQPIAEILEKAAPVFQALHPDSFEARPQQLIFKLDNGVEIVVQARPADQRLYISVDLESADADRHRRFIDFRRRVFDVIVIDAGRQGGMVSARGGAPRNPPLLVSLADRAGFQISATSADYPNKRLLHLREGNQLEIGTQTERGDNWLTVTLPQGQEDRYRDWVEMFLTAHRHMFEFE